MHFLSGRRSQEWRSSLEPTIPFYDAIFVSAEGYAGDVPITHKYAAVQELLSQCEEAVGDGIEIPEEESPDQATSASPSPASATVASA
jgi:hypothetical protein